MMATFNGDLNTAIILCYSPTHVTEELEVEKFYLELAKKNLEDKYPNTIC